MPISPANAAGIDGVIIESWMVSSRLPAWLQVVRWGALAACVALVMAHFAKESPAERERREFAAKVKESFEEAASLQAAGRWGEARAAWGELLQAADRVSRENLPHFEYARTTCRREIARLDKKIAEQDVERRRLERFVYDASVHLIEFDLDTVRRFLGRNTWVLAARGGQAEEAHALYAALHERARDREAAEDR
jgi:type VI protein secretion system component VasF